MNVEEAQRRLLARQRGEKPETPRLKIFQISGRGCARRIDFIGTVQRWPLRSRSNLFPIRSGDFWLENHEGEKAVMAVWSICPGDFDLIETFVREDGSLPEPDKDDPAVGMFDAYEKAGFSRTEAISSVIEDLLDGKGAGR